MLSQESIAPVDLQHSVSVVLIFVTRGLQRSDGSDCLTSVYTSLKSSNGYSDIRTLLDSDTSLYGADCCYTDPNATAKDPPTSGDATLSRGMVHVGPCEIWLDDTMVLSNDDCMTAYGDGTVDTKSVFTPVDYSSCSTSGCMLRFYWLAFQGVDSEIVWQVYKDCVPLTGPASGSSSSTSTTTVSSTTSDSTNITSLTTENEADTAATSSTTTPLTASATAASTTTSESTTNTESSAATGNITTESSETGDSTSTTTPSSSDMNSRISAKFATTGDNSWNADESNTHGNGNQVGNGWSGGFGGMGGGLRN
ncbi:unnamed protein product [Phytophthora fragariaefolia]|uniref:Unnamed protein product n=1 Tax=Phytophthora fragariaefolia TaxID=1490495 RepID=A0A9W6X540_9STRA|nr:unnamed protein product [Phytophthora fragariaefolia]